MSKENILFSLKSRKHLHYIYPLVSLYLKQKHKVFINFYRNEDDEFFNNFIKKNKSIKLIKFIKSKNFLTSLIVLLKEIEILFIFLKINKKFYKSRLEIYGSKIQKKILNSNFIFKFLLEIFFILKFFRITRIIATYFKKKNIKISNQLKENNIKIIYCMPSNHKDSGENEYLFNGKKNSILTAIIIMTWDTVTTKSLFYYKPSIIFAWNYMHTKYLKSIHNLSRDVYETGSMFFEKWFFKINYKKKKLINKKNILYLGSSEKIVKDKDYIYVKKIKKLLDKINIKYKKNYNIIFRPHPANKGVISRIKKLNIKIDSEKPFNVISTISDKKKFYKLVENSAFVIGINNSALIDSMLCNGKTVLLEANNNSINQKNTIHFNYLNNKAFINLKTLNEKNVNKIINETGELNDNNERKKFIEKYIFKEKLPSKIIYEETHKSLKLKSKY